MEARLAFLCDAAVESGGKLHALGIGIDVLSASQVPVRHPRLSLVLGLDYNQDEVGEHTMGLRVVDADGQDAVPQIEQRFPLLLDPGRPVGTARFVMELQDVQFNRWGQHEFHIYVDNRLLTQIPLQVARLQQAPPAQ